MIRVGFRGIAGVLCGLGVIGAQTQSAPPAAPATFTGCAMPLADDPAYLTLCEKDSCELLRGKVDPKWAHHVVTLRGTLHLPNGLHPRTLDVTSLVSVGEACTKACTPPLNGRGMGDKPGTKDLGTPGKSLPEQPSKP